MRNASPHPVAEVRAVLEGGSFVLAASTCEGYLGAGAECHLRMAFLPLLAGPAEARLRVEGASVQDEARLSGTGVAQLHVKALPHAGARVGPSSGAWACDAACTVDVRVPELVLRAGPTGFPTWAGDCPEPTAQRCVLRMDGDKEVWLMELAPALRFEYSTTTPIDAVAVHTDGDLWVSTGVLQRISPTGAIRWTAIPSSSVHILKLDGAGNAYVMESTGQVSKYSPSGERLWFRSREGGDPLGPLEALAVSPGGDVYVLWRLGDTKSRSQVRVLALDTNGNERWRDTVDNDTINWPEDVVVDATGAVYVASFAGTFHADQQVWSSTTPTVRKYRQDGERLWEREASCSTLAADGPGGVSCVTSWHSGAGGHSQVLLRAEDGLPAWEQTRTEGVVDAQVVTPSGQLVLGGTRLDTPQGWFGRVDPTSHALTPLVDLDGRGDLGTRVQALAVPPTGDVVVTGSFESKLYTPQGGFLRVFHGRILAP